MNISSVVAPLPDEHVGGGGGEGGEGREGEKKAEADAGKEFAPALCSLYKAGCARCISTSEQSGPPNLVSC